MTIGNFLNQATEHLKKAGVKTARLDVLVIMEDQLEMDRSRLLAHLDDDITNSKIARLNKQIVQRSKHVPLAYIRGRSEFYGREFAVNEHVLVPRPESEAIIDILMSLRPAKPLIADIGTGSGCLGITAALEIPGAAVELYDIDPRALGVAKTNARKLGVKAALKKADLLRALRPQAVYDVILANLPYVPEGYEINRAASFEPTRALFAGSDGLDAYRRFWSQTEEIKHKPLHIITESLPEQHAPNEQLAAKAGYKSAKSLGLAQLFRLIR